MMCEWTIVGEVVDFINIVVVESKEVVSGMQGF